MKADRLTFAGGHISLTEPLSLPSLPFSASAPRTAAVYFLISGDGDLLYIGQSGNLRSRLQAHRRDKKKAGAAVVHYVEVEDKQERLALEAAYIAFLLPKLNAAILLRIARGKLSEIRWRKKR